jgi:hypothetical protein
VAIVPVLLGVEGHGFAKLRITQAIRAQPPINDRCVVGLGQHFETSYRKLHLATFMRLFNVFASRTHRTPSPSAAAMAAESGASSGANVVPLGPAQSTKVGRFFRRIGVAALGAILGLGALAGVATLDRAPAYGAPLTKDAISGPLVAGATDDEPEHHGGLEGKITSLFWKELGDKASIERGINRELVHLPANGVLGIHFYERFLQPDDDLITSTPHRVHYDSVHSEPHRWLNLRGVVDVTNLGMSAPIPLGGPATLTLGWSAGTALEYSVLRPYDLSPGGALELPKSIGVDLLASRESLRKFAHIEGSMIGMRGNGNLTASAAVNAGRTFRAGPFDVNATAGVSFQLVASGEMYVSNLSLGDGRVFVLIGRTADLTSTETEGASIGATLNDDAVARARSHLPKGAIADFLAGRATDEINAKVADYLVAQATFSQSQSKTDQHIVGFVLNVDNDEGADAAIALQRLEMGPALSECAQGKDSHFVFVENDKARATSGLIQVSALKLFLMNSLEKERSGKLVADDGTSFEFKQSLFSLDDEGILQKDRNITWEGTRYVHNGTEQTFYHLTFGYNHRPTGPSDVAFFQRAANIMGAKFAAPITVSKQGNFISRHFHGANGPADEALDVYYTRDGLKKLQAASDQQLEAAWSQSLQGMRGSKEAPAFTQANPRHELANRMLDQWAYLNNHDNPPPDDDRTRDARLRLSATYWEVFHEPIWNDATHRQGERDFIREMGSIRGLPEEKWVQAFSRLGRDAHFHMWTHLGAIANIVGHDDTLVHKMTWAGKGVSMLAKDGAYIPGIDEELGPLMAPP